MRHHRINRAAQERKARAWNAAHPVGTSVILTLDDDVEIGTITRSEAWLLAHGQAVVALEGKAGGWDLARVRAIGDEA